MSTPASERAEEFLRRIFPEPERSGTPEPERSGTPEPESSEDPPEDDTHSVRGVDERRQQLLEPIGDPDRESW